MKRKRFLILILISFLTLVLLHNAFAQDYTRFNLLQDAKLRIGKGKITDLAYSPDGNQLAVSTHLGIWLYDARTGQELNTLLDHTQGRIIGIAYSPDGRTLVSGILSGTIRLWDTTTGNPKAPFIEQVPLGVYGIALSPDGKTIASGAYEVVHLWDAGTGERKASFKAAANRVVSIIAFSPDGKTIASGSDDGTIRLWDVATATHKAALQGHTRRVISLTFSPDGRTLASSSWDYTIRLWDTTALAHKATLTHPHIRYAPDGIAFSPDGSTLAHGGYEDVVLWDVHSGQLRRTLTGHTTRVENLAFSPDGRTLATGSGEIRLWDVVSGKHKTTFIDHMEGVTSLAFSPDGRTLAGSESNRIRLWDGVSGAPKTTLIEHTDDITSVAFSPDGRTLASSSWDKTVRLWNVTTGTTKTTLTAHTWVVTSVAFSPDGRTLASSSWDKTVRLWDARSGQHKATLTGHTDIVNSVAFSPDGKTLASGSRDKTVRLWDARSGQHQRTLIGHTAGIHSVAFSPDGNTIATGTETLNQLGEIWLWNAATGKYKVVKRGFSNAVRFAFSPDGQTLATETKQSQQVMLWDAVTGVVKMTFPSYSHCFAFSPDGQTLATGTGDGFVFLWELTPDILQPSGLTSTILPPLPAYPPQIRLIYFYPSDYTPQPNIDTELETLAKETQDFYAQQMENHGFGRKTFQFETDSNGKTVVHHLQGSSPAKDYISQNVAIVGDVENLLDLIDHIYLVVLDPSLQGSLAGGLCGLATYFGGGVGGGAFQMSNNGRLAVVYASGHCAGVGTTAHELGHTFGLQHDYRDKDYVMNHGSQTPSFSYAAAEWLNVHPFLNPGQPNSENLTTIEVLSSRASELQFRVADPDGLHQAQLVLTEKISNAFCGGAVESLSHYKALNGNPSITFKFVATEASTEAALRVIDRYGTISWQDLLIEPDSSVHTVQTDDNSDATVNIQDTVQVAQLKDPNSEGGDRWVDLTEHDPSRLPSLTSDNSQTETEIIFVNLTEAEIAYYWVDWAGEERHYGNVAAGDVTHQHTYVGHVWLVKDADGGNLAVFRAGEKTGRALLIGEGTLEELKEDINKDGVVNIQDLVQVAANFGETGENAADVNGDGVVNIIDLTLVAGALGETAAAPAAHTTIFKNLTTTEVAQWLQAAQQANLTDPAFQRGVEVLKHLRALLVPKETSLLANYPNPFNPETWIPYQLAASSDVTIEIHAIDGTLVRKLSLGHRAIGTYQSRTRAAYWDGRNQIGEPVASGVYFYTLTAGEFTATRKMLIRK